MWIALTAVERNQYRRKWKRKDDSWFDLIKEACRRFRLEYGHHPQINTIHDCLGFETEPSISVVTALHTPEIIEELPDRYCTFRVVQQQAKDTKDYYLACWTLTLSHLLNWTEEMVKNWALTHHSEGLNGIDRWFTHEEPDYYITDLLIPNTMRKQRWRLNNELFDALRQDGHSAHGISHYDWEAAKQRVQAVINKADKDHVDS